MNAELEQLKSVLRSLVVSSPTQVDVRSLFRDYRNMIGAPVPLSKYGHRTPTDFLRERCSDCFLFSGPTSNPVLTLIVPDSLKHIDKFVQKQKIPSTRKFNPKRRSVLESVLTPHKVHTKSQNLPTFEQPKIKTEESNTSQLNLNAFSKLSIDTTDNDNNDIHRSHCDKDETDKTIVKPDDEPIQSCDAVKNFLRKRLPAYDSIQEHLQKSPKNYDEPLQDDDSGRHTSSSSNNVKAQQLDQLKFEILKLISKAPQGIWCTDLIRLYREEYGRELNFSKFGYTSIISLVYSMEAALQVSRPALAGDWRLCERAAAPRVSAPCPRRARVAPVPHASHAQLADPDDALPGIDYDPDVFPEDCMHYLESIEPVSLSDFQRGAMIEVMIGEVYSPSHFWFIRVGEKYNIAMEDMMDEMSEYYNKEGRDRVLAQGAIRVGHYCASLYEKDWHRSLIVKIIDSDTVKVRHVDYGTVDSVSRQSLRPLRRCWAGLPAQAARCVLAGVRPGGGAARWPHSSCAAFLQLVSERRLVANVLALDARAATAEVLLIDTSAAADVCLGAELVRAGHADARSDAQLGTRDVHLYPRFEALERGDTPNFAEIHAYLRDGIALDYVQAYRDHVPRLRDLHECSSDASSDCAPDLHLSTDRTSHPESPRPDLEDSDLDSSSRIPLALPLCKDSNLGGSKVSLLSPLAPPYVPATAPQISEEPTSTKSETVAPENKEKPPSDVGKDASVGGVTLSAAECDTYRALAHVNPEAAHWYMLGALGLAPPRRPRLYPPVYVPAPHPPLPYRHPSMHPVHPSMHPPHPSMPPIMPMHLPRPPYGIAPPPGFGKY